MARHRKGGYGRTDWLEEKAQAGRRGRLEERAFWKKEQAGSKAMLEESAGWKRGQAGRMGRLEEGAEK